MNDKLLKILVGVIGSFVLCSTSLADDTGGITTTLAVGAEYTTGSYGTDADIEDVYIPLSAIFEGSRVSMRITVPYLSSTAPEGTVYDPDGVPIPGSGADVTESGIGDVLASVTVYDVIRSDRHRFVMDITGKVKFGTADYDKGLGTGENDYSIQADFLKFLDRTTLIASLGYRVRGEPTGVSLDNSVIAALGTTYRFTSDLKGGLFFDYRQSSLASNDDSQEISAFLSRRLSDGWKIQFYVLAGFSDSTPDFGGGLMVKKTLTSVSER
jgi:hypothetical protein